MATLEQNKYAWNTWYTWEQRGDEWSEPWGGADMQWFGSLLPRLHNFLPAPTILEIAPGFGRWSQFLKDHCKKLILVDISEKCIDACKERFADIQHIDYYVNSGTDLNMLQDNSVDFMFSFDSLVHAEDTIIESYLYELRKKLTSNGVGFIHHSNLGNYKLLTFINRLPRPARNLSRYIGLNEKSLHWRAPSMTAEKFYESAKAAGLRCLSQEIVNWQTRRMIDCISIFTRKDSIWATNYSLIKNTKFKNEAAYLKSLAELYSWEVYSK